MREELDMLRRFLERCAEKEQVKAENAAKIDYLKGFAAGQELAYELCAKWIAEILEREG